MFNFETLVNGSHDSERLSTAFYRYVELHSSEPDVAASLKTEMVADSRKVTIALWSADAVTDFKRFLRNFRVDPPAGLVRPWGGVRVAAFDDL